jgi:hypothetical protein
MDKKIIPILRDVAKNKSNRRQFGILATAGALVATDLETAVTWTGSTGLDFPVVLPLSCPDSWKEIHDAGESIVFDSGVSLPPASVAQEYPDIPTLAPAVSGGALRSRTWAAKALRIALQISEPFAYDAPSRYGLDSILIQDSELLTCMATNQVVLSISDRYAFDGSALILGIPSMRAVKILIRILATVPEEEPVTITSSHAPGGGHLQITAGPWAMRTPSRGTAFPRAAGALVTADACAARIAAPVETWILAIKNLRTVETSCHHTIRIESSSETGWVLTLRSPAGKASATLAPPSSACYPVSVYANLLYISDFVNACKKAKSTEPIEIRVEGPKKPVFMQSGAYCLFMSPVQEP